MSPYEAQRIVADRHQERHREADARRLARTAAAAGPHAPSVPRRLWAALVAFGAMVHRTNVARRTTVARPAVKPSAGGAER